ncbi:MAG: tetratricopeptide repeat protein [Brevundimonas sp.]
MLCADLLVACGRAGKSRKILADAIDAFALYAPEAALALARQSVRDQRSRERLRILDAADQRLPNRPDVRVALARALYDGGDAVLAERLCDQVLATEPGNLAAEMLRQDLRSPKP